MDTELMLPLPPGGGSYIITDRPPQSSLLLWHHNHGISAICKGIYQLLNCNSSQCFRRWIPLLSLLNVGLRFSAYILFPIKRKSGKGQDILACVGISVWSSFKILNSKMKKCFQNMCLECHYITDWVERKYPALQSDVRHHISVVRGSTCLW